MPLSRNVFKGSHNNKLRKCLLRNKLRKCNLFRILSGTSESKLCLPKVVSFEFNFALILLGVANPCKIL